MTLFEDILNNRGLTGDKLSDFLSPKYENLHDPYLLPDMQNAVSRLKVARTQNEPVTIYGDYDIDGLSATTLLFDALKSFGFKDVRTFIPNRFSDGYGLTVESIETISKSGAKLVITVDCGSLSHEPIARANELGLDVIVTDHHNASEIQPKAVAVINPKRFDSKYPFSELAGVGVAFKLVQALQSELSGLSDGQEKWLLDLVALGTVCDVVPLIDENRILVYYGLKVLKKTKRLGIRALAEISNVRLEEISSRDLGFAIGPRLNAAGRLETAKHSLELLISDDPQNANRLAKLLDEMNRERRIEQDLIFEQAADMASSDNSNVLVLVSPNWNHGIVGIVAAKILEKYKKPVFVMQEIDGMVKGSARSFGDFSAADAIRYSEKHIIKGGGHKLAAGVTLKPIEVDNFRKMVNQYYDSLKLNDQQNYFIPEYDAHIDEVSEIDEELVENIKTLEPFGNSNPEPIVKLRARHIGTRLLGAEGQHVKITVSATDGSIDLIKFNAPESYKNIGNIVIDVLFQPIVNSWNNKTTVEGRILHIENSDH